MKNTNTKEYKATVRDYLLPIIIEKAEGYGETITGNPFKWLLNIAKKEVGHEFERHGEQGGLTYWLSGLGLSIDFYNGDIVALAESWHGCKLTEKQADTVIENWFNHIAFKIIQFSRD